MRYVISINQLRDLLCFAPAPFISPLIVLSLQRDVNNLFENTRVHLSGLFLGKINQTECYYFILFSSFLILYTHGTKLLFKKIVYVRTTSRLYSRQGGGYQELPIALWFFSSRKKLVQFIFAKIYSILRMEDSIIVDFSYAVLFEEY